MPSQSLQSQKLYSDPQASTMPSIYDTYLCREPANDVAMLMRNGPDEYTASLRTLQRSADYFAEIDQNRVVERLQLEMARVHMQYEQWERATRVLLPLWQTLSWRQAGWWHLLEEIDWALRECARRVRNVEILIAVEWELTNEILTPRQDWQFDFSKTLEGFEQSECRPRSVLRAENIVSCISATFAFGATEGNVGENLLAQIVISSRARKTSSPITVSQIRVTFEGNLRDLTIQHDPGERLEGNIAEGSILVQRLPLQSISSDQSPVTSNTTTLDITKRLVGAADLIFLPGVTKAFDFNDVPREAGLVEVTNITLCVKVDDFDIEIAVTEDEQMQRETLWVSSAYGVSQRKVKSGRSTVVKILPKPPKMQIEILNQVPTYFVGEFFVLNFRINNQEDEDAVVTLEAHLPGALENVPKIGWAHDGNAADNQVNPLTDDSTNVDGQIPSKSLGLVSASENQEHVLRMGPVATRTDYHVEMLARYHLLSDPETSIAKSFLTDIVVALPFDAHYEFTPMLHPELWPNYFSVDAQNGSSAAGIIQRWSLISKLASLADVSLLVEIVELRVINVHEDFVYNISPSVATISEQSLMSPNDVYEHRFTLDIQKMNLEDRQSSTVDLQLHVTWRRDAPLGPSVTTILAVPRLVLLFSEPRVIASAHNGLSSPDVIHLEYCIENPSTYTLTFDLTMDTNEDFAFSGPKSSSLHLVPLSRHTVRYNLMPLVKGVWISPQFRVYDTHFRKALKVNGSEGMRNDKNGVSLWVDADG